MFADLCSNPKVLKNTLELGYTRIGYETRTDRKPTKMAEISPPPQDLIEKYQNFHLPSGNPLGSSIKFYSRLTFHYAKGELNQLLTSGNAVLQSYDLIAIEPKDEASFRFACTLAEVDIITFDCSQKTNFAIKTGLVKQAIARGIFFELKYTQGIAGSSCEHLISTGTKLALVTKGKNIIFSGGSDVAHHLRGPHDIINLGVMIGLSTDNARKAVTVNPASAVLHGETRRTAKGAIGVMNTSKMNGEEQKWRIDGYSPNSSSDAMEE
ncbi:ribonuclease P/MRP 30kDa subunit [Planoprotostelium fungivorum]|uniref:Ribonuclease P/MRP 30kDa subunit n=1 Tax=Planoprotostelium fungivorum TaxID=1890364 RepID=A0A2P6P0Y1_9EUKA|nr:ribonuclease P/MRP 30kDa subunit [Planoprotostelium fungivorum]